MALDRKRQHLWNDGAHRLSALIAWVHDDYGDKHTSMRFFDNIIPQEQERTAENARRLINSTVGSYNDRALLSETLTLLPRTSFAWREI